MSLSDWAAIGNIVSGIAVLISLIYLTIQIRQNTNAMLRAEANAAQEQFSNWRLTIANNPELTDIWTRGIRNAELTELEQRRFTLLLQDFVFGGLPILGSGKTIHERCGPVEQNVPSRYGCAFNTVRRAMVGTVERPF